MKKLSPLASSLLAMARQAPADLNTRCMDEEQLLAVGVEHGVKLREVEAAALDAGLVPERYRRNIAGISMEEQATLLRSRVAVAGLGGLGGYVVEFLARAGVGYIRAADGDHFDRSNLNRQLLCTSETIGQKKAAATADRVRVVNPAVEFVVREEMLDADGFVALLEDVDLVVDALGGIAVRRVLQEAAARQNLPLVTGAVAGWTALAATVLPGDTRPEALWQGGQGAEEELGCLAPVIGTCASLQCAEVIHLLAGRSPRLAPRLLAVDLLHFSFDFFTL
ncbi:MAG: thiamine biosynthesis protein ThiF [Desulfobulbus propionicus]|nr:MAG: thiamine biosynthesis protein ThiF [Desulfobulbus propionicus]